MICDDLIKVVKKLIPSDVARRDFIIKYFKLHSRDGFTITGHNAQRCFAVIGNNDASVPPTFYSSSHSALTYIKSSKSTVLAMYSVDLLTLGDALKKVEQPHYRATLSSDAPFGKRLNQPGSNCIKPANTSLAMSVTGLALIVSAMVTFVALASFQGDLLGGAIAFGVLVVFGLSALIAGCCLGRKNVAAKGQDSPSVFRRSDVVANQTSSYVVTHVNGVAV